MTCSNCGGTSLKWSIGVRGPSDVLEGRLRTNEVRPIAYLYCEECSETLKVIDEDQVNLILNQFMNG